MVSADLIVVKDGGKVVEAGTHEALLQRHGVYAQLTRSQRQGLQAAG